MMKQVKYQQIAEELRNAIDSGEIPPGGKVPSVSELRTRYEVSHITVMGAYQQLVELNYIENYPGRGYFVRESNQLKNPARTQTLGLFVRSLWEYNQEDVYFNEIIYGIQQECARLRYLWLQHFASQTLHITFNEQNFAEVREGFLNMADKVDGFLVDERIPDELLSDIMTDVRKPMLVVNRRSSLPNVDSVFPAVGDALKQALELALRLGYDKFALIITDKYMEGSLNAMIRECFRNFILRHAVSEDAVVIVPGCNLYSYDQTFQTIQESLEPLHKGKILLITDIAPELFRRFQALNRIAGRDYGMIAVNDLWSVKKNEVPLATLQLKPREVGTLAVRQLTLRLQQPGHPFSAHSPDTDFTVGSTL